MTTSKIALIEFLYDDWINSFITSVRLEFIFPGNKSNFVVINYPIIKKRAEINSDENNTCERGAITFNQSIENVSSSIRDLLKDCVEVVVFTDKDFVNVTTYLESKTDLRLLK